jgi:hypothetical protein
MYDWRIPLPLWAPDPIEDLHTKLWTTYARFRQIDPTATIYMYFREDRVTHPGGINTVDQWNEWFGTRDLETMRSFFNPAMIAPIQEFCTVHVLIGSQQTPLQLTMSTYALLGRLGYTTYVKVLQIEETRVIGWLAWTHFRTDKAVLRAKLEKWCGFPVGLHWRVIWIRDRLQEHQVRALHVEVHERHWVEDLAVIRDIYNATREVNFPLHARFCFVVDSMVATDDAGKMNCMQGLHENFGENIRYIITQDFTEIDTPSAAFGNRTLRDLLMDIPSLQEGYPLFLGIDRITTSNAMAPRRNPMTGGWNISVLPQFYVRARTIVAGLLSYLHYVVGPEIAPAVDHHFRVSARNAAQDAAWDLIQQRARTANAVQLDYLTSNIHMDVAYHFEGLNIVEEDQAERENAPARARQPDDVTYGDGSVSTIGVNPAQRNAMGANLAQRNAMRPPPPVAPRFPPPPPARPQPRAPPTATPTAVPIRDPLERTHPMPMGMLGPRPVIQRAANLRPTNQPTLGPVAPPPMVPQEIQMLPPAAASTTSSSTKPSPSAGRVVASDSRRTRTTRDPTCTRRTPRRKGTKTRTWTSSLH